MKNKVYNARAYRDAKNAAKVNPKAKYHHHPGYGNAKAYRDAVNKGAA